MPDGGIARTPAKSINALMNSSRHYISHHIINLIYEIHSLESNKDYTIDLTRNIYTNFQFQSQDYPCVHAFKVILSRHEDPVNYMDECYKVENYRQTYAGGILPPAAAVDVDDRVSFEETAQDLAWGIDERDVIAEELLELNNDSSDEDSETLKPLNIRRPVGRPKKRRIRHCTETKPVKLVKCGRYSGPRHNKRTYRESLVA